MKSPNVQKFLVHPECEEDICSYREKKEWAAQCCNCLWRENL